MPENKNQAAEQEEVLEETAAEESTETVEASEADQLKEQLGIILFNGRIA